MTSSSPTQGELDDLLGAAKEGNIRRLEYLIQEKQLPVDTHGPHDDPYYNGTLFLISCQYGQLAAMERLLQLGANVNAVDEGGRNAMHLAAQQGHENIVNYLLQKHPDMIKQTDNEGDNAMHLAAWNGYDSIVSLLIQKYPDMIKQTNDHGNTPLDYAVMFDKPSVVWTILKVHKVDITHCREFLREKAKSLLAVEEARRAKSQNTSSSSEGDTNASTQGVDDTNMKKAYSFALKFGTALSRELQILVVGAENTGKSCLISSFLGETFIEGQIATSGAETEICKIYCKNWSRMNVIDIREHLRTQFISQFKQNALKAMPRSSNEKSVLPSSSDIASPAKDYPIKSLPPPHLEDMQEASSYTPTSDPDSLNAVVWDFAGQVIFHNTHSIFISESGVPVITFNASMNLSDEVAVREGAAPPAECCTIIESIHYWLQVVDSMCSVKGSDEDHSPLLPTALLAGTHIDKLHDDIKEARKIAKRILLPILEKELFKKPYARHLAGMKKGLKFALEKFCFFLSNKCRDEEIDRLKNITITVAASLKKKQPIFFLKIEQSLLLLKEQIISKSKMADVVAKSCFSISEDSLEFMGVLSYFHSKRAILHFSQIESLKDLVILSPRWLAKLFSYVITAHSYITGTELDDAWELLTNYGILHENLLVHMLEKFLLDYPIEIHITKQQVIDILLCFHLVALINRKAWFAEIGYPSIPKSGETFIVPSLVPRDETKTIPCTEKERTVYFKFDTGFIPTSVLNQLIADCICQNVKRGDQLLWMRHGKVGLQLGAHQKYYISRCTEKQSIQLTITVSQKGSKCVQERIALIDGVTDLLYGIMKVFMPAANRPVLFIPCAICSVLHITLKQVRDGNTVYCPSSTDDSPLYNYYSDLLSVVVLTSDQPNHQNLLPYFDGVSDWKRLGLYLLPEKYTPRIDDIDKSHKQYVPDCRWELTTEYLKVGEVSWNKVIYALEKSGHPNIAGKIRRDVFNIDDVSTRQSTDQQQSHNTTASGTDVSTTPSTDHEKHEQSLAITASVSDVLVSTKPSTDQKRHEQSHIKTASIGDVLTTELSSDVKKHQQSRNTTASDTDLSAKASGEHKRCEPQSHSTAASGTSTKRRCVEM